MKTAKGHSKLRILFFAVCAFLSCILFALGFALPKSVFAEDEGAASTEKKYALTVALNKKDGYAFTNVIINDDRKYDLVEVTVTYTEILEEGSEAVPETLTEKLVLSGAGNTRTAETGETVRYSFASDTITATVTPRGDYPADSAAEPATGTLAVTVENQELKGITAEYIGSGSLTTASSLKVTNFLVNWAYNDGTKGDKITESLYEFDNYSLFPDEFPVAGPYDKEVGIILTSKAASDFGVERFTTTATVRNITFSDPTRITGIVGNRLPKQYARSDVDYGSVAATFRFGSGFGALTYDVPLNVFKETSYITPTYYNASGTSIGGTLTTDAKFCTVNIRYECSDGSVIEFDGSDNALSVEVEEIPISAPNFPSNLSSPSGGNKDLISFYTGVNVDITGLDYSYLIESGQIKGTAPKISVTANNGAKVTPDPHSGDKSNIEFPTPGIDYEIRITLLNEDGIAGGDFQWNQPSSSAARLDGKYTIVYTIQVEKGKWDLTLSGITSCNYGDAEQKGTVKGDLQGTAKNEDESFTYTETVPTEEVTTLEYHLAYTKDTGVTPTKSTVWTNGIPKDAGKYWIKAVSHETDYYYSAESEPQKLTISPKQISAQNAVKDNVIYDGTTYTGTNILKTSGITDVVVGDDLKITVKSEGGGNFSAKYYNTADTKGYKVVLTLGNKNYVFKALPSDWSSVEDENVANCRTDDSAYFLIKKREIKYNVSQADFYYGASSGITASLVDPSDQQYLKTTPDIAYTGNTNKGTTVSYSDRTTMPINTWDAGDYEVTYTPVYGGSDEKEKASLELKPVTVNFKINKAQISNVTVDAVTTTYNPDGAAQTFTFNGWNGTPSAGGFGKYADIFDVLTRTVTGERLKAINLSSFTGATVELTDADVYTVNVKLTDTDNFEWTGGGKNEDENKTAIWTIKKYAAWKAAAPNVTLTYNHAEQSITLGREGSGGNWAPTRMQILGITGTSESGATIADGFRFDTEEGKVFLTKAGDYKIKVGLKDTDNFAWYDSDPTKNGSSDPIFIDFTLNQATAALYAVSAEIDFTDSEAQYFVLPKARSAAAGGGELTGLAFTFTVTKDGTPVAGLTQATAETTEIKTSGDYVYTITGFTGDEADNYAMPAGGLTFTFYVKSQNLVIPTFGTDNKLEYNGNPQSILQFITNYAAQNYGKRIVITIKKGSETVSSGSDPEVKDVYLVGETVTAYSATVKPAPNYKWNVVGTSYAEDQEFPFTFTVNQFGLTVTWKDGTNGTSNTLETVYGTAANPQYSLDKRRDSDVVSITIGYKDKNHGELHATPTTAGNYFVYAAGLEGAAKGNYYLKTNVDTAYTVKKQTIVKPLQNGAAYTGTFGNGTTASGNLYGNPNSFTPSLLSASVEGYRPAIWFNNNEQQNLTIDETNTSFDVATGIFHYVNAGYYKVTFTIKDGANYCWQYDSDTDFNTKKYEHSWSDFAKIERQELTAPKFGETEVTTLDGKKTVHIRAQEWGTFNGDLLNVSSPIDGVAVTVKYGTRTLAADKKNYIYNDATSSTVLGSQEQEAVGKYYIYVKVAAADILNYVWGDSADGTVEFVDGADEKMYSQTEVSIKLNYAITSTQLLLKFQDIVYTFGDNGLVDGNNEIPDLFSALKLQNDGSLGRLTAAKMDWVKGTSEGGHIFFVDGKTTFVNTETKATLTADELENELPWNAGTYLLSFEIRFSNGNYQNLSVTNLPVTVNPRALELDWTNLSKTYSGTDELGTDKVATATMKNVPVRESGAIDLPTLTVSAREGTAKDYREGGYTLYISALDGSNKDNFTYTGAKNSYGSVTDGKDDVPFVIEKYAFTATGKNVDSHVYGEKLPSGPEAWEVSNDIEANRPQGFDEDIKNIKLSFIDKDGVQPSKYSVGTYTVKLAWSSAEAGKNYDMTPVDTAELTVVEREITIELTAKSDKQTLNGNILSSVYYADSTNYSNANYLYSEYYNGTMGGAVMDGDHPFELRSEVYQRSAVKADGYPITIKVTDGNYKVTVCGTQYEKSETATDTGYKHVVTEAELIPKISKNAGGTYNAQPYVYLTVNTVKGSTNADLTVNANNAQWFIFKADESTEKPAASAEGWKPYDAAGEHFGKDAGNYYFYVKVTATNHTTFVSDKYSFTINKATLKEPNGIISGSHGYNAKPYAYLSETRTVTGVNKTENVPQWQIGIASENATAGSVSWVDYAAATHSRTNVGKDYFFVKITAKNHEDLIVSAADGKPFCLDITKATLTVSATMSIFFNEENPATAGYYMEGGKVTVDKLKQGYADGIFSVAGLYEGDELAALAGLSGAFTYSVASYTKGVSGIGSNYTISLTADSLSSDNYSFDYADGKLTVKALPVSATISPESVLTAKYGATGLQMPVAVVKSEQTSTYGTGLIDITNLSYASIVTVNTAALVAGEGGYTTSDVARYDITLTFANNFVLIEGGYTTVQYEITPADNEITTEGYELFQNADSWKEGSEAKNAAWTYGKFADDGYKADGRHALRAFDLLSRAKNLKITLAFNGTSKEITVASEENIQSALTQLFAQWASFNAGSYTVTYSMEASQNYNAFREVWNFTVAKRAITVTPDNKEVVYGDPFTGEFTYQKSSDLDGYGDEIEQITDIVTDFSFGTVKDGAAEVYKAGWRKDVYEIKVLIGGALASYDGDSYTHETANYVFTFRTGDFNVKAREVTITIKEASNRYMLVGDYHYDTKKYDVEKWADLDYEIDGTLFDDVVPFTLRTAALIDGKTTKAVGKYAIYAVYNNDEAKNNYTITIGNKAFASGVDTGVYADENENLIIKNDGVLFGGVFSVEKAVLHAERSGPYFKLDPTKEEYTLYQGSDEALYMAIYDGREKYYFATTNVDRDDLKPLVPTFTPVYTQVGNAAFGGVPKNVGTYHVSFVPDVANSNFADLSVGGDDIVIGPRPLSVTPSTSSDTERVYNGNPYSVTFTFNTLVGEEVLGLNVTVNGKASDSLFTVTGPSAGANRNVFAVSATKAGTYKVKAQLSGAGMNNYSITNNLYEYDLVIKSAGLFVVVQKATIEYGTPLTPNSLFKVAYSLSNDKATETDPALGELIQSNIASGAFTDPASFAYVVGEDGNRYSDGIGGTASKATSTFGVTISNIHSDNYTVTVIAGELEVVQRKISVNVYGVADKATRGDIAHNVYDGNNHSAGAGGNGAFKSNFENNKAKYLDLAAGSLFGNSGMTIEKLGVMLRIQDTAIDAGLYRIYADDIDPNFEIGFRYNNSVITDENRPRYQIDHRPLTAKVQGAGTSYTEAKSTVSVVYGNEAAQSLFTVCYSGWVSGQESKANEKNVSFGIGGYRPYTSQVGQTYEIGMIGLTAGTNEFANYDLKLVGATLNITPRPIGASTKNETFTPNPDNYNGGAWGLPVEASITFTGVAQERMNGLYTLSYDTKADSLGQTAKTAPVKVGEYHVTVILKQNTVAGGTYYNYTFSETDSAVRSFELPYNILKKEVNLTFDNPTVYEAGDVVMSGEFCAAVMDVVSVTLGEKSVENYTATNDTFFISVGAENGAYTVTIELKTSAKENYQLTGNVAGVMQPLDRRVIGFTFSSETNRRTKIVFDLNTLFGWTYSDKAMEPAAEVQLDNDTGTAVSGAVIIFDYAPVTSVPNGTELNKVYDSLNGWSYDNTQWNTVVSNTGRYILRARYMGQSSPEVYHASAPKYYYFEIAKKELTKPAIKEADYVYKEQNGAGYIEGEIENYIASAMQIVSAGVQASYANDAMQLVATGKGEFAIRIALTDTANYVWADDKTTDEVNLVWSIRPADDNSLAWDSSLSSVNYAEEYSLVANPQKYRFNIRISYAYTARTDGEKAPAAGASWTMGLPVNAGKYWVRATGISPEGNYTTAPRDRAFEIKKVTLTLNPSGSMKYGGTFNGRDYAMNSYTIHAGLVNGDTEQMILRDLKNVQYRVTDAPASGLWQVKNYSLTMSAEATNYTIESLTGTFSVTKARLYVTIGNNASSLYKRATNVAAASVSLCGTVVGEDEEELKAELKDMFVCDATSSSDAGRYEIRLSAAGIANYTLSVTNGVYTINKLPVRVEVNWGGYDYGKDAVLPSVTSVYDGSTKLTLTNDEIADFRFVYAGFDGVPTTAGDHIVSVQVADSSNYALATPVSGLFVIRQTVLDADLIVWEVVYYDTEIKKPTVVSIRNDEFKADDFTIRYLGDWDHAGVAYTIELTLKDPASTKWKSVEGAVRTLTYTVSRGYNALVDEIEIEGWVYGDYSAGNLPTASAKFGTVSFEYSNDRESGYTTAAPIAGDAGEYWVRAVVEGTSDYERFVSPAVKFVISPKPLDAPSLYIITEGYGQNNVYTGVAMQADVLNYNSTLMYIRYEDGTMIVNGNLIKVVATNAGTYRVTVTLVNDDNYVWADGTTLDENGDALLTWTIARKKLAVPTHNDATLIVNGQELAYYPIGFDSSIMKIEDNTSGYGGTFKATVSLLDTDNYEWADGSTESVVFEWHVVGADSVFVVIISILSVLTLAAAVTGGCEGYVYYNKKKKEEQKKSEQSGNAGEGV